MKAVSFQRRASVRQQRGIAAIEFALVSIALFLVLYWIATFGAVMYIQQVVSRAAEDGARAVALLPAKPVTDDPKIKAAVYDSLAAALVVPKANSGSLSARRTWIQGNTTVTVSVDNSNLTAIVRVTYAYSANRILPLMPVLGPDLLIPESLVGRATAAQSS